MRRGRAALRRYQRLIEDLLATLRARGPPAIDDTTIAAHLLRIRDPSGQPLTDEQLAPEIGILYLAGVETSAHTVAFVLCALAHMRPSYLPSLGWRELGYCVMMETSMRPLAFLVLFLSQYKHSGLVCRCLVYKCFNL